MKKGGCEETSRHKKTRDALDAATELEKSYCLDGQKKDRKAGLTG